MTCRPCDLLWRIYLFVCRKRPFDRTASREIDRLVIAVERRDERIDELERELNTYRGTQQ